MNKVIAPKSVGPKSFGFGSVWEDPSDGELFILGRADVFDSDRTFVAISLTTGNRWKECAATEQEAVSGLILKFEEAEITVNPLKP